MDIRLETPADHAAIERVERAAFGRDAEALLVDRVRADGGQRLSLVATLGAEIVAHVLFSEARLEFGSKTLAIGALGPVAVMPADQAQGIGSALIRAGLARAFELGWPAVIVLGHPEYYARFGFERADAFGIRCALDVPPEAFMITWAEAPIAGGGVADYHPAFADV